MGYDIIVPVTESNWPKLYRAKRFDVWEVGNGNIRVCEDVEWTQTSQMYYAMHYPPPKQTTSFA